VAFLHTLSITNTLSLGGKKKKKLFAMATEQDTVHSHLLKCYASVKRDPLSPFY